MVLVEKTPCEDEIEALKIEREFWEKLGATLNTNVPSRTIQEYLNVNKDKIRKRNKEYREQTNVKEYQKQ